MADLDKLKKHVSSEEKVLDSDVLSTNAKHVQGSPTVTVNGQSLANDDVDNKEEKVENGAEKTINLQNSDVTQNSWVHLECTDSENLQTSQASSSQDSSTVLEKNCINGVTTPIIAKSSNNNTGTTSEYTSQDSNTDVWSVTSVDSQLNVSSYQYQQYSPYHNANNATYQHYPSPKNHYGHQGPSPTHRQYNTTTHAQPGTSPNQLQVKNAGGGNPHVAGSAVQHIVHLHVNPGETISFNMGDHMQLIQGPATVRMVSNNATPPIPMPVQVPPGHMVQQIVDENGTLRHIILSPQPPVAVPIGTPYNPGAAPNTAPSAGPSPFFVFPHAPYSHSSHPQFHPHNSHVHMQPLSPQCLHNHGMSQSHQCNSHSGHQGPVPPSSHNQVHKDERTQRQFNRLRRKLETRQKDTTLHTESSPHTSPKKSGVRRKSKEQLGPSGDEAENSIQEEEDETRILTELLSSIKPPSIKDITARSALVQWTSLQQVLKSGDNKYGDFDIQESDFIYELYVSDKNKDFKPKPIFSGNQLDYLLNDLKPATEYYVSIRALLDEITGCFTESITFKTLNCEPDIPFPPKLITRSKTYLALKWNATCDNGSKITSYILEYDEGDANGEFKTVFTGLQRQFKVTKLNASTCYRFRLIAVNDFGKSPCSEEICFYTSGSAPSQPNPPTLKQSYVNQLHVEWQRRPNDDEFTLQMEEESSRHGFLPVCNGRETSFVCNSLKRNTEYKFRICANNEEGSSPWSKVVSFYTLPDRPQSPGKPLAKGRIHPSSFKVAWDSPKDNGGSAITKYILELDYGNGFKVIFSDLETEFKCEHLQPGTSYPLRVSCVSAGGQSAYSEVVNITTAAVFPGKCHSPKLLGKPKALSLHLKWTYPDYDGGSPITEYEVEVMDANNSNRQAYKGPATDCAVAGLYPGKIYYFQVRAINKVGHGPWSDFLEATSGAGCPDSPKNLRVSFRSSSTALVIWEEPENNGSPIIEYHLECSQTENDFNQVFAGSGLSHEVKGLIPATQYYFRVQALNSIGSGPYSENVFDQTPPSSPGIISLSTIVADCDTTSLAISWKEPDCHGSEILSYNVEVGETMYSTESNKPEITIEDLTPETCYKIRIQAVNSVGPAQFSNYWKVNTKGLPPNPPSLECIGYNHNSFKLKWGDGRNPDFIQYLLEMENKSGSFASLYLGSGHTYKVNKLQETTAYKFRICAINEAGNGPYSEVYTFTTTRAVPPALKAPKVCSLNEITCSVDWQAVKVPGDDPISYQLQLLYSYESEWHSIYRGHETNYVLQNLESNAEYSVRVSAIRHCRDGSGDLHGAFSPSSNFITSSRQSAVKSNSPKSLEASSERQPLTDQQWAVIILCGFTLFAILVAIAIQHIISYSKIS